FIKSPVLCCGENITFHQVAKFSVPLHTAHKNKSLWRIISLLPGCGHKPTHRQLPAGNINCQKNAYIRMFTESRAWSQVTTEVCHTKGVNGGSLVIKHLHRVLLPLPSGDRGSIFTYYNALYRVCCYQN
uniref:hypothetical protein n=1 Tax=Escherichia coli TaxID=562 RepID=UPI00321A2E3B